MKSLAAIVDARAESNPKGLAFRGGHARMSWADYAQRSDRLAGVLLAQGLGRGDRVAVVLPDGPGVHAAFLGVEKAGLVTMGIGPRAGRAELEHLVGKSGARALVSRPRYRDLEMATWVEDLRAGGALLEHHLEIPGELSIDEPIRVDGSQSEPELGGTALRARIADARRHPDELFLLNSTSGTTGMPKCVTHDQARWNHFHALAIEAGELSDRDIFLSAIPAPFGFGLWTAHFTPTLLGAACVVMPGFDANELVREIERNRVSVVAAVSTQFVMMLDSAELNERDLSSLRILFTGGEAVPYERALEFEERTGSLVLQFYGSNETGALSYTTTRDSRDVRLRSAGRAIDSMQVRLFDEGGSDVTASGRGLPGCKGPLLSGGYWNDEAANRELLRDDGWMMTGDIATLEDGVLRVIGRSGDFIIRGGKNISGSAVEQAVAAHPDVRLAAAVAMPDRTFGERVCAYVELRDGAKLTLEALIEHLRAREVSSENLPERLIVVDQIPRSSGGKVAKQQLRDDIKRRLAAEGEAGRS